jgi:hypothetical protein
VHICWPLLEAPLVSGFLRYILIRAKKKTVSRSGADLTPQILYPRYMKRERLLCTILGLVLVYCMPAAAQEKGNWRAASSTAKSVTGDVTLSDEKISINYSDFPIARIRNLEPSEMSAAFDADNNVGGSGSLYRLSVPYSKKIMHRNTLCGSEDIQWMATYVAGRSLDLVFFSGQKAPVFTPDAIANSTDLCGTFSYVR